MNFKMRIVDLGAAFWYFADHFAWLAAGPVIGALWHHLTPTKRLVVKVLCVMIPLSILLSTPALLVWAYVGFWPGTIFAMGSMYLYTYRGFRSRGRYGRSLLNFVTGWCFEKFEPRDRPNAI